MIYIGTKKVTSAYVGTKKVLKIYKGTDLVWQRAASFSVVPFLPDDLTTYPLHTAGSYAAKDTISGANGYYNPSANTFTPEAGMTGDVIQRVEYIEVANTGSGSTITVSNYMVADGLVLMGADTVEMELYPTNSGRNTFGWYGTAGSNNNYSLYLSTGSSYCRYDGGLYRSLGASLNTWHTVKFTPNGSFVDNVQKDSWSEATFTCGGDFHIFNLPNSTSARFAGRAKEIKVNNGQKAHIVPVKAGAEYHYFDITRWALCSEHSQVTGATPTFSGGTVISDPIPFPTT